MRVTRTTIVRARSAKDCVNAIQITPKALASLTKGVAIVFNRVKRRIEDHDDAAIIQPDDLYLLKQVCREHCEPELWEKFPF